MDSRQLASALLRLYPRAWRERYGEELLGLIDDAGLTWRIVADVILGAVVERVRAFIAIRNQPRGPIAAMGAEAPMSFRDSATQVLAVTTLIGLTIGALVLAGAPWPQWQSAYLILMWNVSNSALRCAEPSLSRPARVGLHYYLFLESTAFIGAIWLLARGVASAGVPSPSEGVWFVSLLCFVTAVAARFIYCGIRKQMKPASWMGLHDAELRAWRYGTVAMLFSLALLEPSADVFWPLAALWYQYATMPSTLWTRAGAARHRAAYELNEQRLREKFPVRRYPAD